MRMVPGSHHPLHALSAREFEVFRLLVAGHPIAEIARLLSLSCKTVANHQSNIRAKLDTSTGAQLVRMAMTHGVLSATSMPEAVPGAR